MEKLSKEGLNLTEEKIKQLKAIFPESICDGKIDFDKLRLLLGDEIEDKIEKYQFTWNGKSQTIKFAQSPSTGTLIPCKEESVNFDTTENLYIEGDNVEVLKILQKTYHNKIKMIYIDPPYNTGNDFVYKDDFKDNISNYKEQTNQQSKANPETNGRYHTDWLNMMYSRLMIAKNLLTDDGFILISIDDNEVDNLSKISSEIFGLNNVIGKFIVNSTPNARDYGHIGKMHEYIVFIAKNVDNATSNMLRTENVEFKYNDAIGGFNIHPLYNSNEAFHKMNRPNLYYPFYVNPTINENGFHNIYLEKRDGFIEVFPPKSLKNNIPFVWRWSKEKTRDNLNSEIIGYRVNEEFRIMQKMRKTEKIIRSILSDQKYTSRRGTAEMEALFNGKIFSFPKPTGLIKDLLEMSTTRNSIILDFFSGSATTAHAVMQLNAEDDGNRKFIMVQLPELTDESSEAYKAGYKNICEIGKERIRRAGQKIKKELDEKNTDAGLFATEEKPSDKLDIGFKVFKLDSTNLIPWDGTIKEDIFSYNDIIKPERRNIDVLYEIMLKYGIFDMPVDEILINNKTMYSVAEGHTLVCLCNEIDMNDIKEIVKLRPKNVIFKESGFKDDNDKINALYTLEKAEVEEIKCI